MSMIRRDSLIRVSSGVQAEGRRLRLSPMHVVTCLRANPPMRGPTSNETTPDLFGDPAVRAWPDGFRYQPDSITVAEEAALLEEIRRLEFHAVEMHGVVARRRVIQYGWKYGFDRARLARGPEIPSFLLPCRDRAAAFAEVDGASLSEALLTEYQPGAPIGWHRDAPGFGLIVGISLMSACRFRFRRGPERGSERVTVTLEPRSSYVLSGPARSEWQHSIPEVDALRYSITFRTLRR
jgi:alkylated DNA repair dioxygenase AlkB